MAAKSKIEWTESSWNPVAGCTKISDGCENCYAEKMAYRLACMGQRKYDKVISDYKNEGDKKWKHLWNGDVFCDEHALEIPLHWRKPRRIFVCSMSDLFHPAVPFEFIDKVFYTIIQTEQHIFQILTKRPERMLEYFESGTPPRHTWLHEQDAKNFWLGVTCENRKELWRLYELLKIQAAIRFVSFEPLLEDIREIPLTSCREDDTELEEFGQHIDWVIVGCESGPNRRPCKTEWVRSIVSQCKAAGVPVFVKQLNIDGKVVHKLEQFPKDLQIREYPKE